MEKAKNLFCLILTRRSRFQRLIKGQIDKNWSRLISWADVTERFNTGQQPPKVKEKVTWTRIYWIIKIQLLQNTEGIAQQHAKRVELLCHASAIDRIGLRLLA
jgi:hypothetical protein